MTQTITDTLAERGKRYGRFEDHARIAQALKDVMRATANWEKLTPAQREGLEMVQHKIARMLNGDPTYIDNVLDIEGYSHLIRESMEAQQHGVQS